MTTAQSGLAVTLLFMATLPLQADLPRLPVESFAALPHHAAVRLSPSGRHVAARVELEGSYGLVVYDLQDGSKPPFLMNSGDFEVRWQRWASDQRLLVSVGYATRRGFVPTTETRLIAMDPDGGNGQVLVPVRRKEAPVQIADTVVDLLRDDPDHILMSFNPDDPRRPRLWRVNIHNARRSSVAPGRMGIDHWSVDQQGRPRIGRGIVDNSVWRIAHRGPDQRNWEALFEHPVDSGRVFSPQLFDHDDPDLVYVLSNHETGLTGLYSYRLSTREFVEQLFLHRDRDVVGTFQTPDGREIAGVYFADDEDNVAWFNEAYAELVQRFMASMPDRQASLVSVSADLSRAIFYAGAPGLPGRYYLFEAGTGQAHYLAPTYPQLEAQPLATPLAISYRARDGLVINGYLTLPPGLNAESARSLPAVVMPHGGPHSRDTGHFDPMVQMLANRGYAVLQMNFRGSSGFGSEFMAAGTRQWGQAMQDDVTDGTQWLIDEGLADAGRICIVGGSYGGYAALMGAAREPGLYACAASVNGVSDLPRMLRFEGQYIGGRASAAFVGDLWSDRRMLAENSPVNRADDIQVPVLLIHGNRDRVVNVDQSRVMARALARAGRDHLLVELEGGDHALSRADHRLAWFSELDRFLAQHLAPRPAGADPAP